MGPIPEASKLPKHFRNFFPNCPKENWGPVAFKGSSFDFGFLQKQIFHPFPPFETTNSTYITRLNRVESHKTPMWEEQGIYDLIQLSRVGPRYNPTMLLVAMCFWDICTNTFHLPCGMVTPTLFDIVLLSFFAPMGRIMNLLLRLTSSFPSTLIAHS